AVRRAFGRETTRVYLSGGEADEVVTARDGARREAVTRHSPPVAHLSPTIVAPAVSRTGRGERAGVIATRVDGAERGDAGHGDRPGRALHPHRVAPLRGIAAPV